MYGYYDMLVRSQIPFDIITDLKHSVQYYPQYDCIILPSTGCLPDEVITALRGFVMAGGKLISGFDCTFYDSTGVRQENFALSDIFGVSFDKNYISLANHNYFQPDKQSWLFNGIDIPLYPAPLQAIQVNVHDGAEVLARYLKPLPGRYVPLTAPEMPFIIHNKYGKGESLFIAGTFGEMYNQYHPIEYRKILTNAIHQFTTQIIQFDKYYGSLEVVIRKQGQRILVHLVNYNADMTRPFETIWPLKSVTFALNSPHAIRKVYRLTTGKQIPVRRKNQEITVRLPELGAYEVIVFE